MSKKVRYELLRRAKILPEIHHRSVGGAIMASLLDAPTLELSRESFIPKSFMSIILRDVRLGWGEGLNIKTGQETAIYIVERVTPGPFYVVRAMKLDGEGYPIKSDYRIVESDLTFFEALWLKKTLQEKTSYKFYDVFPEEFSDKQILEEFKQRR